MVPVPGVIPIGVGADGVGEPLLLDPPPLCVAAIAPPAAAPPITAMMAIHFPLPCPPPPPRLTWVVEFPLPCTVWLMNPRAFAPR